MLTFRYDNVPVQQQAEDNVFRPAILKGDSIPND